MRPARGLLGLLGLLGLHTALVAGTPADTDDLLPAAIEALLAQPEDPVFFGIPILAGGTPVLTFDEQGTVRALADVGDVSGDGAPDFATAFGPGTAPALVVRDARSGTVLWADTPDGGGARSARALAAQGGHLVAGLSSPHGRVTCRSAQDGSSCWSRDLLPVPAGTNANVLSVRTFDAPGADGDVLVAGGRHLDGVWRLAGSDGATVWMHAAGDTVCDARALADLDADGVPEVLAVGGDRTPFARLLSGADGRPLWSVGLPGPGTVIEILPDIDGDGVPDAAIGLMAQPAACLVALSGASGAPLWESPVVTADVTSLATLHDIDEDGLADLAVGGFDNAVASVLSGNGSLFWRAEGTTNNTGAMLSVVSAGDVDGNGAQDIYTTSVDHQVYVVDGALGVFLTAHDLRGRGVVVAALGDGDADDRPEVLAGGEGRLTELAGASGIAAGPVLVISKPSHVGGETLIEAFAYPTALLVIMGSLGTGHVELPGYGGAFGLDPTAFVPIHSGIAPAAGLSGYNFGGLPRAVVGLTLHFQAVSAFEPGHGLFSPVYHVPWTF
jgi:hypothetical protein